MPLLFDGHWYASKIALSLLDRMKVIGTPHITPDGRAVLVFDRGGVGSKTNELFFARTMVFPSVLVPQDTDGHDLLTVQDGHPKRVELDPSSLPDLERLVEFDHLPEARQSGALEVGLHKRGDKLALVGN